MMTVVLSGIQWTRLKAEVDFRPCRFLKFCGVELLSVVSLGLA